MRRALFVLFILLAFLSCAFAQPLDHDPIKTPGLILTTNKSDVCQKGWAKDHRHTTQAMKNRVYKNYDIQNREPREYEIDHLVSLELGGADDELNLWPQSYRTTPWNAYVKDKLENKLHRLVCNGEMDLIEAQEIIRTDWQGGYIRFFGNPPGMN